jgi:hypothetical protein
MKNRRREAMFPVLFAMSVLAWAHTVNWWFPPSRFVYHGPTTVNDLGLFCLALFIGYLFNGKLALAIEPRRPGRIAKDAGVGVLATIALFLVVTVFLIAPGA